MLPNGCANELPLCCHCLFEAANQLIDVAADAVIDCLGPTCSEFERYVSHAAPQDFGDFVAAWIDPIAPMRDRQSNVGAKVLTAPRMIAVVNVRLVEEGWPALDNAGGRIVKPSAAERHYVSSHSYSHAEAAWRAMLNVALAPCSRGCDSLQFVQMRALTPQARWVAWEWQFNATLVL